MKNILSVFLTLSIVFASVTAFTPSTSTPNTIYIGTSRSVSFRQNSSILKATEGDSVNDIIGRRIIVKGDVNGGYIRTCVQNEASRFRKLIGTMSPPEDTDTAEIYVEGKRKMVEGFIRWCAKGSKNVGLSQTLEVVEVIDEDATGLYDDFYVKTK
mmetsp:Transcript_4640/g.6033  ORF Transcript_4640/g.6033 Transcript_4640/m.6033 type:complete len:156 (-) Transcript_4640:228-695(-)